MIFEEIRYDSVTIHCCIPRIDSDYVSDIRTRPGSHALALDEWMYQDWIRSKGLRKSLPPTSLVTLHKDSVGKILADR